MVVLNSNDTKGISLTNKGKEVLDKLYEKGNKNALALLKALVKAKIKSRHYLRSSNMGAEIGDSGFKPIVDVYGSESSGAWGYFLEDILILDSNKWLMISKGKSVGKHYLKLN